MEDYPVNASRNDAKWITAALVVVIALALIACSRPLASVGPSPTAAPSKSLPTSSATSQPTFSPDPSTSESLGPSQTPEPTLASETSGASSSAPDELERSDAFWGPYAGVGLNWVWEFGSLSDMVNEVDLVIRGRVVGASTKSLPLNGQPLDHAVVHVAVDEILKGDPQMFEPGTVRILIGAAEQAWPPEQDVLPMGESLFFLKNDAVEWERRGGTPPDPDFSQSAYIRPSDQAILRDIGGQVSVIGASRMVDEFGADRFPLPLDGTSYNELLSLVRTLVEGAH